MLGRQRRGTASSEVLWMIIAVPPPYPPFLPSTPPPLIDFSSISTPETTVKASSSQPTEKSKSPPSKWTIRLYAVRGLTAVVVANLPGSIAGVSSLTSGAGGKRPQAVLWGTHEWSGARHELLNCTAAELGSTNHSTSTLGIESSTPVSLFAPTSFSAWMRDEDDFPKIICFDIAVRGPLLRAPAMPAVPAEGGTSPATSSTSSPKYWGDVHSITAEVSAAGITYATVLAESPTSPSALQQRLDALATWKSHTSSHAWNIAAMAISPNGSTIATLDGAGGAAIWDAKGGVVQLEGPIREALSSLMYPTPPEFSFTCIEWLANPLISSSNSVSSGGSLISPVLSPLGGVGGDGGLVVNSGQPQQWLAVVAGRQILTLRVGRTAGGVGSTSSTCCAVYVVPDICEEVEGEILGIYSRDLNIIMGDEKDSGNAFRISSASAGGSFINNRDNIAAPSGGGISGTSRLSVSTTTTTSSPLGAQGTSSTAPTVPVLLVLHKTNSTDMRSDSTHATVFELHCNPQHAQQLQLRRLTSAMPICLPPTITASISAAAPLPGTNGGLILGTSMGKVHTVLFSLSSSYTTGGSAPVQVQELGHYVTAFSHRVPVVALSVDRDSGLAAAVSGSRTRPQLAIWQLSIETPNLAVKIIPSKGKLPGIHPAGARLKPTRLTLRQSGSSVAWAEGLVVPCIVLGDTAGGVTFFAATRDAAEGWKAVARAEGGPGAGPVACLKSVHLGPSGSSGSMILAAAGPLLMSLSDGVVVDNESKPLSR